MRFNNLKRLSFDEIDNLLDYLTDGEEVLDGAYVEVSTAAKAYKAKGISSIVVAEVLYDVNYLASAITWQWLSTLTSMSMDISISILRSSQPATARVLVRCSR